jgi:DtxR family Mn-dependent transcriptional regulator
METKALSVTDMLKKLAEKDLVNTLYQGVSHCVRKISNKMIVRKHRLWKCFRKIRLFMDEVQ